MTIPELYGALICDDERNRLIVDDVLSAVRAGRSPLILTERTHHLDRLAGLLRELVKHVFVLRGGMGAKQRRAVREQLASIPEGEERVLIATGRYIGEGFDDARLDTLFLALPISWRGTLQQYAWRLHRRHASKQLVQIYDYADVRVPALQRMYEKRLQGYREMGYVVRGTAEVDSPTLL